MNAMLLCTVYDVSSLKLLVHTRQLNTCTAKSQALYMYMYNIIRAFEWVFNYTELRTLVRHNISLYCTEYTVPCSNSLTCDHEV